MAPNFSVDGSDHSNDVLGVLPRIGVRCRGSVYKDKGNRLRRHRSDDSGRRHLAKLLRDDVSLASTLAMVFSHHYILAVPVCSDHQPQDRARLSWLPAVSNFWGGCFGRSRRPTVDLCVRVTELRDLALGARLSPVRDRGDLLCHQVPGKMHQETL